MTRNSELLDSFAAYCVAHPDERFFQALKNWLWERTGRFRYVYVSSIPPTDAPVDFNDTFHWEEVCDWREEAALGRAKRMGRG